MGGNFWVVALKRSDKFHVVAMAFVNRYGAGGSALS